jgi:ApaG protein
MTKKIDITVKTSYLTNQSDPANSQYVFTYTITIHNSGDEAAKLMSRHWIITDAHNHVQEVKGDGVVGEQPHLVPGQTFEYTSGAVLNTPVGCMQGTYNMVTDRGEAFTAEIPLFRLAVPEILH